MKTYAIVLERSKERSNYIAAHLANRKLDYQLVPAIDGRTLTPEDIKACCDMEQVNKYRSWLSNGAIGCALSHRKAYAEFLATGEKAACIVEDDAVLPENISDLLHEMEDHIKDSEIILLYYASFRPALLSTAGSTAIGSGLLCYPMDIRQTITATAYVIGRAAARNLGNSILPVSVTADAWYHYYHEKKCFTSFRVLFPLMVRTRNFKSVIDYLPGGSLKSRLSAFIDRFRIPFLYQMVKRNRKKRAAGMTGHFSLTDDVSPIYERIQAAGRVQQSEDS